MGPRTRTRSGRCAAARTDPRSRVARRAPASVARATARSASRSSPEPWQDLLRVEPHRSLLILSGEVEDEVIEAPVEVRLDLRNVFVGVVRHDEPRVGLVRGGLRAPLHLTRVLDADFALRGLANRRP